MDIAIIITVIVYMLSSACYVLYLFFQKEIFQRLGLVFVFIGFLGHTIAIGFVAVTSGHFPVRNLHETLLLAGWAVAGVFLVLQSKFNLKIFGIYAAPLIALVMVAASQIPKGPIGTPAIFKSFWLITHVITIFIGQAGFALACGLAILYLLQERAIKSKKPGFFFKRLPSLEQLDAAGYLCIIVGFTTMTFGLITGFIYAQSIWGRFWSWDPKEVWSGITWLFYAALLHERLAVGWRGRRAAIMAIIGFGVLLFSFLGVNLLLQGHHGQFSAY